MARKTVLVIGLKPSLIDFSDPDYRAFPGLTTEKVSAGLKAEQERLNELGYDAEQCLTDFGETAEAVVSERLAQTRFDCVLIGAGVRLVAKNTALFEKLVNLVHERAPRAKLCFNTNPTDTVEAVQRWISVP